MSLMVLQTCMYLGQNWLSIVAADYDYAMYIYIGIVRLGIENQVRKVGTWTVSLTCIWYASNQPKEPRQSRMHCSPIPSHTYIHATIKDTIIWLCILTAVVLQSWALNILRYIARGTYVCMCIWLLHNQSNMIFLIHSKMVVWKQKWPMCVHRAPALCSY